MLAGRLDEAAELLPLAMVDQYAVAGTPGRVRPRPSPNGLRTSTCSCCR